METLEAIVVLLGLLRAIEGAATPEGSGRNVAQHHELIPPRVSQAIERAATPGGGGRNVARHHGPILPRGAAVATARDGETAARDQREVLDSAVAWWQGSFIG